MLREEISKMSVGNRRLGRDVPDTWKVLALVAAQYGPMRLDQDVEMEGCKPTQFSSLTIASTHS